jgi:hypothetical protein
MCRYVLINVQVHAQYPQNLEKKFLKATCLKLLRAQVAGIQVVPTCAEYASCIRLLSDALVYNQTGRNVNACGL